MKFTISEFEKNYMDSGEHVKVVRLSEVRGFDPHCVWTVVSKKEGTYLLLPGFHNVEAIGYILSDIPWPRRFEEQILIVGQIT